MNKLRTIAARDLELGQEIHRDGKRGTIAKIDSLSGMGVEVMTVEALGECWVVYENNEMVVVSDPVPPSTKDDTKPRTIAARDVEPGQWLYLPNGGWYKVLRASEIGGGYIDIELDGSKATYCKLWAEVTVCDRPPVPPLERVISPENVEFVIYADRDYSDDWGELADALSENGEWPEYLAVAVRRPLIIHTKSEVTDYTHEWDSHFDEWSYPPEWKGCEEFQAAIDAFRKAADAFELANANYYTIEETGAVVKTAELLKGLEG